MNRTVQLLVITAGLAAGMTFAATPARASENVVQECCKYPAIPVKAPKVQAFKDRGIVRHPGVTPSGKGAWTFVLDPPPGGNGPAAGVRPAGSAFTGGRTGFVKGPWFPEPVDLYLPR